MPSTSRGRRAQAALTQLMIDGLLDIRGSAYLRQPMSLGGWIGVQDVSEHIRLIADACHNLPGAVGSRRRSVAALDDLWATSGEEQRAWIAATLGAHGIAIDDLVRQASRPTQSDNPTKP